MTNPRTYWAPAAALEKLESRCNNAQCILTDSAGEINDTPLIRLTDHERLQAETERLQADHEAARAADADLIDRLRQEAQIHAQEARTANATIAEIYRAVTDGTGEPGNWNGADPVRARLAADKARIAELEAALAELRDWYQEHTGLPACRANAVLAQKGDANGQ